MFARLLTLFSLVLFSGSVWSIQVKELYQMDEQNRLWYLIGIYDANLVQWNDEGERSDCIEKLGFKGFYKKYSDFIVALPEDSKSKERGFYDEMNAATLGWMILDKECVK